MIILRKIEEKVIWEDFVGEMNETLGYKVTCSAFNRTEMYLHIVEDLNFSINKIYVKNTQTALNILYSYGFDVELKKTIAWSENTINITNSLLLSGKTSLSYYEGVFKIDEEETDMFLTENEFEFLKNSCEIRLDEINNGFGNYI